MGFKCGIVGLPNVGKSTLFNALTKTAMAQAENYPFCTIEPNVGEVAIPDPRLYELAKIAKSENIVPTRMTFVDIAGLVKGASKGEGLGNQFLANIREMDAIAYVLRCFDDSDIVHVEGKIDPLSDFETVDASAPAKGTPRSLGLMGEACTSRSSSSGPGFGTSNSSILKRTVDSEVTVEISRFPLDICTNSFSNL